MKKEKRIHKTLITESQKQKPKTKNKKRGERGSCGLAIQMKIY